MQRLEWFPLKWDNCMQVFYQITGCNHLLQVGSGALLPSFGSDFITPSVSLSAYSGGHEVSLAALKPTVLLFRDSKNLF